ncbi:MAG: 23S rRNA (pseudouridine(1915)-N(3))-methyltransferase RlmH [Candidatus Gracilibacteria bacterium]
MKIQVIQVGKNKDRYIEEGVKEFSKRLQQFCNIEISTLQGADVGVNMPREKIVADESMRVARMIPRDAFVVVLDEKGKELNSVEFSGILEKAKDMGQTLVFVIGGAFGLSSNLKGSANLLLSMSKMTFTHQMIRPFLLEQIYRGFCILGGKEYHYGSLR